MRLPVRLLQLLVLLVMYVRLLPSRNISDDISLSLFSLFLSLSIRRFRNGKQRAHRIVANQKRNNKPTNWLKTVPLTASRFYCYCCIRRSEGDGGAGAAITSIRIRTINYISLEKSEGKPTRYPLGAHTHARVSIRFLCPCLERLALAGPFDERENYS